MEYEINTIEEIENQIIEGKTGMLTYFEILSLAVQIQRNQILEIGLVLNRKNKVPTSVKAIATALGDTNDTIK